MCRKARGSKEDEKDRSAGKKGESGDGGKKIEGRARSGYGWYRNKYKISVDEKGMRNKLEEIKYEKTVMSGHTTT